MILLIGSQALHRHRPLDRLPRDLDIVGSYDEVMAFARSFGQIEHCYPISEGKKYVIRWRNGLIIEAEIAWAGSSAAELLKLAADDPDTGQRGKLAVASLDLLYLLKMSHRYLRNSPHFLKTMHDIHWLRRLGATIRVDHREFFKAREKTTYAYPHPTLAVAKNDFFANDGIRYIYDHDSIHEAMAHFGKPAYKFYQPADSQVNVSRAAFFDQPEAIRLHGVLEESYVLALERSQIPFGDANTPKSSFDMALKKVCTSITSGFFREYAWEHYHAVQTLYRDDYVERFNHGVESGVVKRALVSDN